MLHSGASSDRFTCPLYNIYSLSHLLGLSTKCPYTNSSENSTHLNSKDWMFGSTRRYKGILIFQGRVNTFGSSIVASYIKWYGDKGV